MKIKKVPLRTCVVSHEKLEKKDLIRVLRTPEGNVIVDDTMKANGRGAYLKRDLNIIEKAKKSKVLDRNLEIEIPEDLYEELIKRI